VSKTVASEWQKDSERGRSAGLRARGLSLIEVVIILAVLAVLVALLVPSTVQQLTAGRRSSTLDEMQGLKHALVGNPSLTSRGFRSDYGYLGDMGNLPATLDDVVTQGAQPAYSYDSTKRAGAGWKGPYLAVGAGSDASSHKKDAFGNDYIYDGTDYTNAQGQAVDAKIVSLGADGVVGGTGVNEDVTVEILKSETTATVTGFAFDTAGVPLNGGAVVINYAANGVLTSSTSNADSTGFWQFTNIPLGMRSVQFEPRLLYVPGSARALGGGNRDVEFRVVNFSKNAITVRSLTATFTAVGVSAAFYRQVRWDGTTVWNCSVLPSGSGTTVTFTANQTVAAGGAGTPPVRVPVYASVVQVGDVVIQGTGTEATVQLREFRDSGTGCGAGTLLNMSGATFSTIILRDPSNVIVGQFGFTVP
jgi:Tfp pilus assembly protein PilE